MKALCRDVEKPPARKQMSERELEMGRVVVVRSGGLRVQVLGDAKNFWEVEGGRKLPPCRWEEFSRLE